MTTCISDSVADAFVGDRLGRQEQEQLFAHLDVCSTCRKAVLQRWIASRAGQSELEFSWDEAIDTNPRGHETREWDLDEAEKLDQTVSDCESVRILVEQSLGQFQQMASSGERCQRCLQSGISEIGRLQIRQRLGDGGTSVVYLAYDTVLRRQVALKLPRGSVLSSLPSRERFLREAQAAALLRHPNIVPVYGAGEVSGTFYITLAYCSGPTLAQWLRQASCQDSASDRGQHGLLVRRPPVSPATAARIALCLAEAVEHAYQSGVLHRDIKPGNILLEPREQIDGDEFPYTPMLADFGLALLANEQNDLTAPGAIVGTPQYMAPEQIAGQHDQLGPATDVYGLGTVLYELLAGAAPIRGRNHADTLMRVSVSEPVLPRKLVSGVPRDLEAICLKCLRKSPGDRYQSAAELAADLRRFLAGEPTLARPVTQLARITRWSWRHPGIATLVGLLVLAVTLLIAGLGLYNLRMGRLNVELNRSLEQVSEARELAEQSDLQSRELLYAADLRLAMEAWQNLDLRQYHDLLLRHRPESGEHDLRELAWDYLWHIGHVDSTTLAASEGDVYFARYSPDGRWILTAGQDAVVRIYDAQTCELAIELPTHQREVNGVALSPGGDRIATAGDDGTVRVWDRATRKELISIPTHAGIAYQVVFVDEKTLVSCGNEPDIRIWNAETGESTGILRGHTDTVEAIEATPDRRQLVSVSLDATARFWDLATRQESRPPERRSRPLTSVAISGDGALAAIGAKGGEVLVFEVDTGKPIARLHHLDNVHGVALSSDGSLVVVVDSGGMAGLWRIPNTRAGSIQDLSKPIAAWSAHTGRAWSVAISPRADRVVTAGSDDTVRVCGITSAHRWCDLDLRTIGNVSGDPVNRGWFAVVPGTASVLTASPCRGLLIWNDFDRLAQTPLGESLPNADRRQTLPEPVVLDTGDWISTAVSEDGRVVAGANLQAEVVVWDLVSRTRYAQWSLDSDRTLSGVTLSPDGRALVAYHSKSIWLLDSERAEPIRRIETSDCRQVVFAPGEERIAYGSGNVAVVLNDLHAEDRLVLAGHSSSVRCLAFSPDGQLIATGSNDRTIIIWDATTGAAVQRLHGHRGQLAHVAFAPDGRSLVAADDAGKLKLWHVKSGQEICVLDEIRTGYTGFDFFPDNRGLVCFYGPHQVRLLQWGESRIGLDSSDGG